MNLVAADPSSDTFTSAGSLTTTLNGNILDVGNPVSTVLICNVTGNSSSFDRKKQSTDVRKIPLVSLTVNVCASGSVSYTHLRAHETNG